MATTNHSPEAVLARENGYIECSECGHPLEAHLHGCWCGCAVWAKTEVEKLRREYGLPGKWNLANLVG